MAGCVVMAGGRARKDGYQSWGRFPVGRNQRSVMFCDRTAQLPIEGDGSYLPYGNGRSYGDTCLNDGGTVIDCRGLDRLIEFDEQQGLLKAEAGVLLSDMLPRILPKGWFLPVTPGTKYVTLGGAIANDVHGKNHHKAGTFGCHVRALELLRSDGTRLTCSPTENPDWFAATVGGMGLTGVITWAEIALRPVTSAYMDAETVRFGSLDEFIELSNVSDEPYDYSVAWFDTLARGSKFGRGLFSRANHALDPDGALAQDAKAAAGDRGARLSIPFEPAVPVVNRLSIRAFNTLYFRKQLSSSKRGRVFFDPFFYPLDGIAHWPRLYGRNGFVQHQCVIPFANARQSIHDLLMTCDRQDAASFLTVLKAFGRQTSPGYLSFPRPGITMTLDFPFKGERTLKLLTDLDEIVANAGGAVNPYKDGRMSAHSYQTFFPGWDKILPFVDPKFSSGFWRRVSR
jgi:FAD/FMN-containing dehydrogenase